MGWYDLGLPGQNQEIGFASGAAPDGLEIRGIWGREKISRLSDFHLLLWRSNGQEQPGAPLEDEEITKLLHAPCMVSLGPEESEAVHGVLQQVEAIDTLPGQWPTYIAKLVPTVWLLTLTRTSRVFRDKSIKTILTEILTDYGLTDGTHFRITGADTVRPYVVQYDESDWDFLARWLEREGLSYWFEQDPKKKTDRLVMGNTNALFSDVGAPKEIAHRGASNLEDYEKDTFWDFHRRRSRAPARATLLDYHDQAPRNLFTASEAVDKDGGFGTVFSFGEHLVSDPEAKALAKLRAERLACERDRHVGRTTCSRFKAGHAFQAKDGEEMLITSVEHRVGHPLYASGPQGAHRYMGRFEAIPRSIPYRPARVTPWPRIDGVLSAHIDTDDGLSGKYAQLDDQGRYWVKMPFDLAATKGQKASCPVRMAQSYSGNAYGAHYPLHKGAEVLIAHIGGDPDRPVIVGTVPTPDTTSTVVDKNATQSVVKTASGIRVELEDKQG